MSAKIRIIRALLSVYPSAWRREYGPELADLLLTRPLAARVIGDVLWNGLRQRIRRPADPFEGVLMTADRTSSHPFLRYLWRRKLLVSAMAVVGAVAAFIGARWVPDQYRSEAVIMVEPPKVSASLVPTLFGQTAQDRLPAIRNQILSRKRLERIIQDLELYEAERRTGIMEDVVERMRSDITVTPAADAAIHIGFVGRDPRTVQKVADRISNLFMDEGTRDRKLQIENTDQFLETLLKNAQTRLVAQERRLELARSRRSEDLTVVKMENEMLQSQYRSLFTKQQEVRLAANLERREIGEQFRQIDAARLPAQPFSPHRPRIVIIGALVGLGLGLAFVLIAYVRRMSTGGLTPDPLEEPVAT